MAELTGVDLGTHLKSIVAEYRSSGSIYNYPERKFYRGFPGYDFSVKFHDKIAATPLGPASGPHTQMAQNIVLSFLGGGRIVELKTVQILDELNIPRPCIDVRNVGFNVEWSQELRLQDSYLEYVKGWILLKLIEELEILGIPRGNPFYSTVFDISVGYDLEGISSQQIYHWLENMKNASAAIGEMMETLPQEFEHLRQIPIDPHIADSVTLSTFHGCPREEIEAIVQHLISEHNFHVVVKMNPTILGYEFVEETLRHNLGYAHIELDQAAFENDLQFNEGVAMMKRLQKFAEKHGRKVGAKFTNTLVVKNNQDVFSDEVMYLSGAPLHVLAMNAMHRFRSEMGKRFHISFSAGITKYNFADAVRCNMKPITTCTDLLKTGGYSRMFDYLKNLKKEMEAQGCRTIEQFIIRSCGDDTLSLEEAGMKNASRIVPFLVQNNRYHFEKNQKAPRKIDSHLTLFDCITCDKCIPVCPNAANFSYPTGKAELTMTDYEISDGKFIPVEGNRFVLKQECQIANIADFCNECGDCDTYCPEYGGPYVEKPRFFLFLETYRKYDQYDGFYFRAPDTLIGRIDGIEYSLAMETGGEKYRWKSPDAEIILSKENTLIKGKVTNTSGRKITVVMEPFYIMKTIIHTIMHNKERFPFAILMQPGS